MAILSDDGKSVKVVKDDTLWGIASKYLGAGIKYKQLATINNISSPYTIYVGQTIKLSSDGGSSGSASTNSNKPEITHFGLQSDKENTLFAAWKWDRSNTASYKVLWEYATGAGVWFIGSNSSITVDKEVPNASKQSTYSIPTSATKVRFKVKPISETKKSNNKETALWTADWSDHKEFIVGDSLPPDVPTGLAVDIDGYKLTMTLSSVKSDATSIDFQIVKDNEKTIETKNVAVVTSYASYARTVSAGSEYKVRCRAVRGNLKSEWSDYSANVKPVPAAPSGITTCRASSETSVYLEWSEVKSAVSYDISYATKREYFDGSDLVTIKTGIEFTHYDITGLESGTEYFFRVRAVNEKGESAWTEIKSVVIGTDPAAPTTWSSTTTAITGEDVTLYWVHNTEDGSSQVLAELELTIDGVVMSPAVTIKNSTDKELKDKTSSCVIDTSKGYLRWTEDNVAKEKYLGKTFVEGSVIQWRVRTAGITKKYGDWSMQRTIDIYAPVTLDLSVTYEDAEPIDTVQSFPFYIRGLPGPNTQQPIGYHVSIVSNEMYETTDNIGNPKTVNVGEEVYSRYFDTSYDLLVEMSAGNIDLENNVGYTVNVVVSMDSGLSTESSVPFRVSWTDVQYIPNAEIGIDEDTLTAYIRPYCEDRRLVYYKVTQSGYKYTKTDEPLDPIFGEVVKGKRTTTGELVYSGMTVDGTELYYCTVEEKADVNDIYLSVYRREFDGTFTEIAAGLDGAKRTTVTDPHPALDYARYRIVATSKETGAVSYYDPPGYPVGGVGIVIQWDEAWSSFDTTEEAELSKPPWSGSLLKLPYNVDISDANENDVSLGKYIGRKHPVTYYGTQRGHTSNWAAEIESTDKETLYGLRRLANWMGDVYVREPSGSGYWANISVSFSQKHCELTIPVTLTVKRVEGGI